MRRVLTGAAEERRRVEQLASGLLGLQRQVNTLLVTLMPAPATA